MDLVPIMDILQWSFTLKINDQCLKIDQLLFLISIYFKIQTFQQQLGREKEIDINLEQMHRKNN